MFFGRIRWTTILAEALLQASSAKSGQLTAQDVKNATQRASETIKKSLKDRIDQFKYTRWIEELYFTAIEADVFSMTRLFSEKQSMTLISEGFATVAEHDPEVGQKQRAQEKKVVKGCLQEPLAVKAVMEYLRDPNNDSLYDKFMDQFFNSLQFDRGQGGALGKMAEFVFTAVSNSYKKKN